MMKIRYLLIFSLFAGSSTMVHADDCTGKLFKELALESQIDKADCDTIIDYKGYSVHVVKNDNKLNTLGLNLFSDGIKNSTNREILDYIETAMLAQSQGLMKEDYSKAVLKSGRIVDLKDISPATDCSITNSNSRVMTTTWTLNGKKIAVELPLGYDIAKTGDRTKIENDFIAKLKKGASRCAAEAVDTARFEAYKDRLYILPGGIYQNKDVTSNIYFLNGDGLKPVWHKDYPLESIADMFLYPSSEYGEPKVDVRVLKHQYGETENFTIPVTDLLAVCEASGCIPYWGVESFENGVLKGALFLYNSYKGYDHVFHVECRPQDVINGTGSIKARASLFIPTNNVDNLFQPYRKKSKDEKINYRKK